MTTSSGPLLPSPPSSVSSKLTKSRPTVFTRANTTPPENTMPDAQSPSTSFRVPTGNSSSSSSYAQSPTSPRSPTGSRSLIGGGIGGGLSGKKSRTSMFLTASDSFFSLGSRGVSLLRKPGHHSSKSPQARHTQSPIGEETPVLDIRPMSMHGGASSATDHEEAEREALREEAAKSVGLVERDPSPDVQELISQRGGSEDALRHKPSITSSISRVSSTEGTKWASATKPSHSHSPPSTVSTTTSEPVMVTPISRSQPQLHLPTPPAAQHIPAFPTTLASLAPYVQLSSIMTRHYAGSSFNFLGGKGKKWKSRLFVLTSYKPPPDPEHPEIETDTEAQVHLFRLSSTSTTVNEEQHVEIERLKIDEDSVVFVVDNDNAGSEIIGRKWVVKLGGLHGGGASLSTLSSCNPWALGGATPGGMAAIGVMGSPSMMHSVAAYAQNLKVRWLVQCPDEETMRKWIAAVKAAVLVQRAERAGLGGSLNQGGSENVGPSGDLDVLMSLRVQGLHQHHPSTVIAESASHNPPAETTSPKLTVVVSGDGPPRSTGGRPRTAPGAINSPTSVGSALKGFFSTVAPGSPTHQRSLSASPPTTPLSTPSLSLNTSRISSLITGSVGGEESSTENSNRASALLNLQRTSSYTTNTSSSNNTPITPNSTTALHGKHASHSQALVKAITPHEERWELEHDFAADEHTKAVWEKQIRDRAAAYDVDKPSTIGSLQPPPLKRLKSSPSQLHPHPLERSFQSELERARTSLESTGADHSSFIRPDLDESGLSHGGGRVSFDAVLRPTPMVEVEAEPCLLPAIAPSITRTGRTRLNSNGSDGSESFLTPQSGGPASGSASSSPKRFRKIPKMLAPPSGPLPSAPLPKAPGSGDMSQTPTLDRLTISTNSTPPSTEHEVSPTANRSSGGTTTSTSFWNSKRISASSAAGISIRSFASSSAASWGQSNSDSRLSTSHHPHPHPAQRPPPTFAPPPPPTPTSSQGPHQDCGTHHVSETTHQQQGQSGQPSSSSSPSTFSFRRGSRTSNPSSPARSPELDARARRLTPPAAPPPSSALPPRPDGSDAGSRGRPVAGHQRGNSTSMVNGSSLSTIPASPESKTVDLPKALGSPTSTGSTGSSHLRDSTNVTVSRHTSLRARLRMMSSPSPRSSIGSLPPDDSAPITLSAGGDHHRPLDVISGSPVEDPPLRSYRPHCSSLPPRSPPIPPRSPARPKPVSISSFSSFQSTDHLWQPPQKTLSPPPVRRSNLPPVRDTASINAQETSLLFPVVMDEIDGDEILLGGVTSS
ncbi:hypothetical protein FRB98_001053 [Tulasnella sp. 332]|nr:hypothetical protein FRB98_001053 [Tulasnella sp. 332]